MFFDQPSTTTVNILNRGYDDLAKCIEEFLNGYSEGNYYPYRNNKHLELCVEDVVRYDRALADRLLSQPEEILCILRTLGCTYNLRTNASPVALRSITAHDVNRLVCFKGILVSRSDVRYRPRKFVLRCKICMEQTETDVATRICVRGCGTNCVEIVGGVCCDRQYWRVQETDTPVGEMPRYVEIVAEDAFCDRLVPGTQATFVGYCEVEGELRFRVCGVSAAHGARQLAATGNTQLVAQLSRRKDLYDLLARSIAPMVLGLDDVKRALLVQLVGGTHKSVRGTQVRGSVHVLLLGDPGIAKSQLLKTIERLAPISVYTSGKGSSAAGLTASVLRARTGEFCLEAGAMVLSSNGICCIDEFDKMDEGDVVAIHEAMEQQTVSIAKAGIVANLPCRTSVLAAANPAFGRYDALRGVEANVAFSASILSRFDMIFLLRDESNEKTDRKIASHVLRVHMNLPDDREYLDERVLREYVAACRVAPAPVLSDAAKRRLVDYYVACRSESNSLPVTVRQLEAIVRIAEALARMRMVSVADTWEVEEAIRLFGCSTMRAVTEGHVVEGMERNAFLDEIRRAEEAVYSIRGVVSYANAVKQLVKRGFKEKVAAACVDGMVRSEKLVVLKGGLVVKR